ncbi:hypothetical protein [Streptomyces sp. NPDC059271]|uniref:zinc finger domain-containing protein n=1 Tax=Streptomyces sp. NPDC059271 TaxID=3346799 RepID=UPI003692331F
MLRPLWYGPGAAHVRCGLCRLRGVWGWCGCEGDASLRSSELATDEVSSCPRQWCAFTVGPVGLCWKVCDRITR